MYPIIFHPQRKALKSLQDRLLKYLNSPIDPTDPEVGFEWRHWCFVACLLRGCAVYWPCVQRIDFLVGSLRPLWQWASPKRKRYHHSASLLFPPCEWNYCVFSAGLAPCFNGIQNRRFETVNACVFVCALTAKWLARVPVNKRLDAPISNTF